ncbi:MAG TPA: single-stranded-DNA-specific exonuclease RecJ [Myxococcota bacterium]|nr:single-stranded-DNA-specific exonuclease RecJ [Myxococcota bacterium]
MQREWEILGGDQQATEVLSRALDIHPVVAGVMAARGILDPGEGRKFLNPTLADLSNPRLMKGIDKAVERLCRALRDGERVCVYGDYDVDGATSVAVLLLFLRHIGLQADFYIPSRLGEGYGLNEKAVAEIAARGTKLLVTVDCGISDLTEVQAANAAGMEVIVIDHHQVPAELPEAVAVLDPHQPDCDFPGKDLAAVGVTFFLVMALRAGLREHAYFERIEEPNLREFLDLVALGTIADIVPLLGDNRIIVSFGLKELTAARRPGVAALKEVSGILTSEVSVGQVAFRLAPRINAVGRLGQASRAVELLTTSSYSSALTLARGLDQANSERQEVEHGMFASALSQAEQASKRGDAALVLWSQDWHVGVVGIVASRLLERFGRPVVMIAMDGESGRGSGRSTGQIHLYQALEKCAGTLIGFGGHRAAAGLTIRKDQLEIFRGALIEAVCEQQAGRQVVKTIRIDARLQPDVMTRELIDELQVLAPFGLGNPEPVFQAHGLRVRSARRVGRDSPYHLKMVLTDGQASYDAIGFSMGERHVDVKDTIDIVYSAELNTWEGQSTIQFKLRDFRREQD